MDQEEIVEKTSCLESRFRFGICILHYGSRDITWRCLDSVLKCCAKAAPPPQIVLVDNGMGNLGAETEAKYASQNVKIIQSGKNLGFARGNNLGFRYLKCDCGCDFILLLNNDTIVTQSNFLEKIGNAYEETGAAVIGPRICTKDSPQGGQDNPGALRNFSLQEWQSNRRYYQRELLRETVFLQKPFEYVKSLLKSVLKKNSGQQRKDISKPVLNCILNGCAMFFTPAYLADFDGLDDRTFMYGEEHILFEHMMRSNKITYYDPSIEIYHDHQAATSQTYTSRRAKRIFQLKNMINSAETMIQVIKEYDSAQ